MKNDLVSIIVPCYNGEKYLNTFFDSILNQTYRNIELIITNDGSTDNSLKIMNSYMDKFTNCGFDLKILNKPNGGQASAINYCLKEMTGEYLIWADCDDYYEFDAIESLVFYLKSNPQFKLVRGKARYIDYSSGKTLRIVGPREQYCHDTFEKYMFETDSYCLPGVNITYTSYFDKCIKDRHIYETKGGQNWQILLPLMYYGETGFLDKVVYNYNVINTSHSHDIHGIKNQFKRCDTLKDILYHVLDSIEAMQEYDRFDYKKRIKKKYFKKKLKIIKESLRGKPKIMNSEKAHVVCDYNKCTGCGACCSKCPVSAIKLVNSSEGFLYPRIDKEKCTNCGLCAKTCPVLNEESNKKEITAYACYNKNEAERMNSSSGGLFILLAKQIIKQNGVVFGACFNDDLNVIHSYAESENDLNKFMTSKYVQSNLMNCLIEAKEFLEKGRIVYFSGTPCQIEGLLHYLGKKYDNLITQDIICHGVPSPKVWRKYLEYRNKCDGHSTNYVNFRNKTNGWKQYEVSFKHNDGEYSIKFNEDLYMKSFLKNTSLRESCYNCSFKTIYRNSDITLGDFWGIEKVFTDMNDNKGISAIVLNSQKGMDLFNKISKDVEYRDVNIDSIISGNSSYINSSLNDYQRKEFFTNLEKMSFDILVKKYVGKKPSIIKRIIRKVI
ncbi:MAG: Coenzyme F420 hydrogenase/dehydrogenase, beta subunit C-terminal domain [Clostridia bacterium]|nr:Coenzyme F420 hydrogenase/dehydrogenase, beta subunit C-terminal domain [Clostridia bacterium]